MRYFIYDEPLFVNYENNYILLGNKQIKMDERTVVRFMKHLIKRGVLPDKMKDIPDEDLIWEFCLTHYAWEEKK